MQQPFSLMRPGVIAAGILFGIMSANADPNPAPSHASET